MKFVTISDIPTLKYVLRINNYKNVPKVEVFLNKIYNIYMMLFIITSTIL